MSPASTAESRTTTEGATTEVSEQSVSDEVSRPTKVRMVHLGLGAFARAHAFWYTQEANATLPEQERWGIAAFTGRSARMAETLSAQHNRYTLIVPHGHVREDVPGGGVDAQLITALIASHDGSDVAALSAYLTDPAVTVVTLTITEAGYQIPDGLTLENIQTTPGAGAENLESELAGFALGRLVLALRQRHLAGAEPITIISCDNLSGNGEVTAAIVLPLAQALDERFAQWIVESVSFPDTQVDRITPRVSGTGPQEKYLDAARTLTGFDDAAPVITEPFSEWTITDRFSAQRPPWEKAGARFAADIAPFEQRKLFMLNGAHSLLAYAGLVRGLVTVEEAVTDAVLGEKVRRLWADAQRILPEAAGNVSEYADELYQRFTNPNIRHELAQIAQDGRQKLTVRIVPVLKAAVQGNWCAEAHELAVAAWLEHQNLDTTEGLAQIWPQTPASVVAVIDAARKSLRP